jgi:pilus assembly protein CpaB
LKVTNNKTKWILMAISVVLGSVSAWAIERHLQKKTEEIESRNRLDEITLLVAARDLSADTVIEEDDIATESFPLKWAPDHSLGVEQLDLLLGKRLMTDVRAGQPIMQMHTLDIEMPGISTRLGTNRKAVTIVLEGGGASASLIQEGDHVDLFVSFDHQGKRITAALLQSVEVLSSGYSNKSLNRSEANQAMPEQGMTVGIEHKDVVKLIAAREAGSISAVLSSTANQSVSQIEENAPGDLVALLGLKTDTPIRNIPILYGDRLTPDLDDGEHSDSTHLSSERALVTRSSVLK